MTVDLDSTICEVSGKTKQGAAFGYTGVLGYHPLVAVRADTGEIVGVRLRGGSSQRGVTHFTKETVGRVRRAAATGPLTVRADAGFWSYAMLDTLDKLGVGWSITTQVNNKVRSQIAALDEDAWTPIGYPPDSQAQVGETVMSITNPGKRSEKRTLRQVVRPTRLTGHQTQLFPNWRYHAFVTNPDTSAVQADRHHQPHAGEDHQPSAVQTEPAELPTVQADRYHQPHATRELAIRDLKDTSLAHLPSGRFNTNAARLLTAALAHNLYHHIPLHKRTQPKGRLVCGRTIRNQLFGIPGRLVNHRGPAHTTATRPMALRAGLPNHPR